MVILGIILVLVALLIGATLLLGTQAPEVSGQEVDIRLLDAVTINLNPLTLVIAGMLTMLLLWLGLVTIKWALTRKAKARRLRKEQEAESRRRLAEQEAAHQEELAQRERDLEEQRVSTQIARERAEVAESHDPTTSAATQRIDTRGAAPADDATRPIRRDPRA
ncbi:hypothetical protein ACFY2Y_12680 [Janibacter hoylei]|uniref:hypothetical protein n=1 Tax=Janibacter hoylei TaxID=364298 RepID=UPI0036CBEE0C